MTEMTREQIIEVRRVRFEAKWPMPASCMRCGDGYAATSHNAWEVHDFIQRWKGYMEALDSLEIELPSVSMSACLTQTELKAIQCGVDMCRDAIEAQGLKVKP